jgi:hypothetical protein
LVISLADGCFTAQLTVLFHISLESIQELSPFLISQHLKAGLAKAPVLLLAIVRVHQAFELFFYPAHKLNPRYADDFQMPMTRFQVGWRTRCSPWDGDFAVFC